MPLSQIHETMIREYNALVDSGDRTDAQDCFVAALEPFMISVRRDGSVTYMPASMDAMPLAESAYSRMREEAGMRDYARKRGTIIMRNEELRGGKRKEALVEV